MPNLPAEISTQLTHGTNVYRKSTAVTRTGHGASRGANFYLLTREAARQLYESSLPILSAPDHQLNFLLRFNGMEVYWAEPPNVHKIRRTSLQCRDAAGSKLNSLETAPETKAVACNNEASDPCLLRPGYCPGGSRSRAAPVGK